MHKKLSLCIVLVILSFRVAAAQPPHLKSADLARLRQLRMPVILPTYVPSGYTVARVIAEGNPRFGSSYRVIYRKGKSELTVQSASGGIGDIPGDFKKTYPFNSKLFGTQEVAWAPRSFDKSPDWSTTGWMHLQPDKMPVYAVIGSRVDVQEVLKVARSLQRF